jgi:hypothetical protein
MRTVHLSVEFPVYGTERLGVRQPTSPPAFVVLQIFPATDWSFSIPVELLLKYRSPSVSVHVTTRNPPNELPCDISHWIML